MTVDKGRDTLTVNSYGLNTSFGNKLNLKVSNGFFDISRHIIVDLHSVTQTSQNVSGDTTSDSFFGTHFSHEILKPKLVHCTCQRYGFLTRSGNLKYISFTIRLCSISL